jgi:hypothetical protein
MYKVLGLVAVVSCASAPPPRIQTPDDYQRLVGELVAQVIDMFRTDGTNCDMLFDDLRSPKPRSTRRSPSSRPPRPRRCGRAEVVSALSCRS